MRNEEFGFIQGWLSGNIWGASWSNIYIMVPWILILTLYVFYKSKTLNVFGLGSDTAIGLGVSIHKESVKLLVVSVHLQVFVLQ